MNDEIEIICDRCGKTIKGMVFHEPDGLKITGGFYDMKGWKEFARGDSEESVCDLCMWDDPKFLEVYPHVRKEPR